MSLLFPKIQPLRDRAYLDHLREQPCIVTGLSQTEPAHLRLLGSGGMGSKPSDARAVPLYWELHREQNNAAEIKTWIRWAGAYPDFLARLLIEKAERDYQAWKERGRA